MPLDLTPRPVHQPFAWSRQLHFGRGATALLDSASCPMLIVKS